MHDARKGQAMKVRLDVDIERVEGKQMSTEMVGDMLVGEVQSIELQVEDTEYEITEVTNVPVKQDRMPWLPKVQSLLFDLDEAFFTAYPVQVSGPRYEPSINEVEAVHRAVMELMLNEGVHDLIRKERINRMKGGK